MSSGHQRSSGEVNPIAVPLAIWIGSSVTFAIGIALIEYFTGGVSPILEKFRGNLFSGFVSMGSVLMAMKAFIVVRLQEKLYCRPKYKKLYQKENSGKIDGIYIPLRNLSEFLVISVAACLTAGVLQIVVGEKVDTPTSNGIAAGFAFGAVFMVLSSWWHLRQNLKDYFTFLEYEEKADEPSGKSG